MHDKSVSAVCTSQMTRLLRADAAITGQITAGGAAFTSLMLTVQACERKGVKTVCMVSERGGSQGTEQPLPFYVPEATSMVSTGSFEREFKAPAPIKVIGVEKGQLVTAHPLDEPFSPWSELAIPGTIEKMISMGIDFWGGMNYTCEEY